MGLRWLRYLSQGFRVLQVEGTTQVPIKGNKNKAPAFSAAGKKTANDETNKLMDVRDIRLNGEDTCYASVFGNRRTRHSMKLIC